VRLDALDQLFVALNVVSKLQAHLPDPSYVEKEDKFVERDSSVDRDASPIHDILPDEEGLLKKVSFSVDIVKILEENYAHHVFDKSPKSEVSQRGLEKLIMLILLELNFFCQIIFNKILILVLAYWRQI
jgi:hypothetical protein